MHQAVAFLTIRVRQAAREVVRSGPVYGSVLVIATISALIFFYFSQKSDRYVIYTYAGLLLLVLSIHVQRSDHRFIRLFGLNPALIYFVEYTTLLLPFIILTIIKSGNLFQLGILLPVLLISFLKIKVSLSGTGNFPVFFTGKTNFEWKAGLRKSGWLILLLWVVALLLTPIPYASIVVLWFILLTASTFYELDEPRNMVKAFELNETKFIWLKIKNQIVLFFAMVIPVLLVSAFFFPGNWWISIFFLFFSALNIAVFVVSKYSVWGPGESHGSVTMINTFCLVGFFLPFLLPLPLFVFIRNYFRARKQLKPILHGFN